jgi:hypothetical protein
MLAALGVDIEAIRDEFPAAVKDPVFLEKFKGRDIVFISHNTKQTTNPIESKLLKKANITTLYLAPFWSKMVFWDQAVWLVRHWPKIDGFAKGAAKGTCAEIKHNGKSLIFQL